MKRARPRKQKKPKKQRTAKKAAQGQKQAKKRRQHDESKRRRVFRLERLPVDARERALEGFALGKTYEEIRDQLAKMGHKISIQALGNYWRKRWAFEEGRVKAARALAERIGQAMAKVGKTPLAVVGRELLFTKVFEKLSELDEASVWELLREARELERVTSGKKLAVEDEQAESKGAVGQAREVRRRWRELYGLDEADEEASGKEKADEPV
jgi:hypothetical protein